MGYETGEGDERLVWETRQLERRGEGLRAARFPGMIVG